MVIAASRWAPAQTSPEQAPTGYILDHRDLWAAWLAAMASAAVSLLVVLGIVVGTHRIARDGTSTRPASFTGPPPEWWTR